MQTIEITTRDGVCPAYVHKPEGPGPWPGVLMFMDAPGVRPAVQALAERLSASGYYVLLPDIFYRAGPYGPVDVATVWSDKALRERHRETVMAPATPARVMTDTEAFLGVLAASPEVENGPVGVVGYCMGGRFALTAAGTYPDRIAAAASYHGGGLANDTATSPHLLAPRMKAEIYVAGAAEDANFPDEQKTRLATALTDAGVAHTVETYPARHGWVLSDMPVHDAAEAEHHWRTLTAFFDRTLKA